MIHPGQYVPHFQGYMINFISATFGMTPLDYRPARCMDRTLTPHNTHNRISFT